MLAVADRRTANAGCSLPNGGRQERKATRRERHHEEPTGSNIASRPPVYVRPRLGVFCADRLMTSDDKRTRSIHTGRLHAGLIRREVLFGEGYRRQVHLSPSGRHLAWVADWEGTANVWVAPVEDLGKRRVVTGFRKGGISDLAWSYRSAELVVTRDVVGDENHRLFVVNVAHRRTRELVAQRGVRAELHVLSPTRPDHAVVRINDRDPAEHDVYLLDLRTGDRKLLTRGRGLRAFTVTAELRLRFVLRADAACYHEVTLLGDRPRPALSASDALLGPAVESSSVYVVGAGPHGDDALIRVDLDTSEREVVWSRQGSDVDTVITEPITGLVQAVGWTVHRREYAFLDPSLADDFAALRVHEEGDVELVDRSDDGQMWLVRYDRGDTPSRYYLFDRRTKRGIRLFSANDRLEGVRTFAMCPRRIRARDRLDMVSYLTMPRRSPRSATGDEPAPLVLLVHGGPHARDYWTFDPEHQWLADRGYAVLSVNFRGSTGFGWRHLEAGRRQWGAAMQRDLGDAVDWAVEQGIADPKRVAIMGASYGGFAALAGLAFTPERYACAVAFCGPSNLMTMLRTMPRYWSTSGQYHWIGDPRTLEGKVDLVQRSPTTRISDMSRPLLIAHGANDVRVSRSESDQVVRAMRERNKKVTYAMFYDEGHGLVRSTNRCAYYAMVEAFLAQHLGGRAEPFDDVLDAADLSILAGVDHVTALQAAYRGARPDAARRLVAPQRSETPKRGTEPPPSGRHARWSVPRPRGRYAVAS